MYESCVTGADRTGSPNYMETIKSELVSFEKLKDLKTLLATPGPCLTVYMPLSTASTEGYNPNAKQNELHWKEILHTLDGRATQFGAAGRELLDSIADWDTVAPPTGENPREQGKSVVVFRSADLLQVALLDHEVTDTAILGPHFFVRPLLSELVKDHSFYLLALSQKYTRLLHCTLHTSEVVPFPKEVKTDFDEWMNQVKPDHTAVNNGMTGGFQGSSGPTALAPKGADQDAQNKYLSHYYKQVDKGVSSILKGNTEPLVLCGVEYEIPMYRDLSSYPHLVSEAVHGAPNGLKSGEMHARALEALEKTYANKIDATLADWNHRVGGGASSRLKDVVTAAHDGRILTLLVSDAQQKTGVFDEATNSVKGKETGSSEDEDLVNDAAIQTILHAGNVLIAPQSKMPNGSALAAIFRY